MSTDVLTLDEYQLKASATFQYSKEMGMPMLVFTTLGMNEEAGEVAGKVKKHYRDNIPMVDARHGIALELGDTLWYLSQTARLLGYTLEDIAKMNINKLDSRRARGVIHGSGDNR